MNSAEWISEATAKVTIFKKLELPGGATIHLLKLIILVNKQT